MQHDLREMDRNETYKHAVAEGREGPIILDQNILQYLCIFDRKFLSSL